MHGVLCVLCHLIWRHCLQFSSVQNLCCALCFFVHTFPLAWSSFLRLPVFGSLSHSFVLSSNTVCSLSPPWSLKKDGVFFSTPCCYRYSSWSSAADHNGCLHPCLLGSSRSSEVAGSVLFTFVSSSCSAVCVIEWEPNKCWLTAWNGIDSSVWNKKSWEHHVVFHLRTELTKQLLIKNLDLLFTDTLRKNPEIDISRNRRCIFIVIGKTIMILVC